MIERQLLEKLLLFTAFDNDEPPGDLRTRLTASGFIAAELLGKEPAKPIIILGQGTSEHRWYGRKKKGMV